MINRSRFLVKNYMRIRGSRHTTLDTARQRIVMISAVFILAYLLVGVRVFDLSVIQRRSAPDVDGGTYATIFPETSFRADIVDRNGVILATSLETASLYADPARVLAPVETAEQLSALFPDLVYGDVLQKLQKKSHFIWLKRNLTPEEQYKVLALGQPGLNFKTERSRIYPQGHMAVHMVGYTDVDGKGLAGIERSFDSLLAKGGNPLALTLDIRLQYILHRELEHAVKKFSGLGGVGAIMDIGSGEILAAVSLPDFDPHEIGVAKQNEIFNNLTLGVFELGSTFKIFSTAALLETHQVPLGYKFDTTTPIKRGRFTISDYHPEKHSLTMPEIFMLSSNIGAALMGDMVGTEKLKAFYADLGLMDMMTLEISEVGKPILPPVWRDINTLTASYGHGIAVTPLQMVVAASGIVNGGMLVQPTLIMDKSKVDNEDNKRDLRIVSAQTAHRMRQMMRLVVTEGTGKQAEVPGYNVGGKTGTAEKQKVSGKGYDGKRKISSFIGFFPMEAPRYAVFVMVDEPKGIRETFGYATGGWVAAPAVGNIIAAMASVLGLKPNYIAPENDLSAQLKSYIHTGEAIHASY